MHNYQVYKIKKHSHNGELKFRIIHAPCDALKSEQQAYLQQLEELTSIHKCAMAFTKDKNIIDNAKTHIGQAYIKCFDLQNFFPSITYDQVYNCLLNNNIAKELSLRITQLGTLDGALIQGSPLSPYLSNLVAKPLDKKVYTFAKHNNVLYTRYADDITLSGNKSDVLFVEDYMRKQILEMNWVINEKKTEVLQSNERQSVTGIVINEKPNIDRETSNKVRAIVHNIVNYSKRKPIATYFQKHKVFIGGTRYQSVDSLLGYLNFMRMVNPGKFSKQYYKLYKASKLG